MKWFNLAFYSIDFGIKCDLVDRFLKIYQILLLDIKAAAAAHACYQMVRLYALEEWLSINYKNDNILKAKLRSSFDVEPHVFCKTFAITFPLGNLAADVFVND